MKHCESSGRQLPSKAKNCDRCEQPSPLDDKELLKLAHTGQLTKMLQYMIAWVSFFIPLVTLFVEEFRGGGGFTGWPVYIVATLTIVLALVNSALAVAIIGKFEDLVNIETRLQLPDLYDRIKKDRCWVTKRWDRLFERIYDEKHPRRPHLTYHLVLFLAIIIIGMLAVAILLRLAHADVVAVDQSRVYSTGSVIDSLNWIGVILGFLATLLGVLLAFQLERWREGKSRKERLIGALEMIKDEVEKNVSLCNQILKEFANKGPSWIQYYNLKTTTWESVSSTLVDLKDSDLSKKIAGQYYEYYHMNRKIDARFDLFKFIGAGGVRLKALTNAVSQGATDLRDDSERLAREIETKISSLRDC